MKYKCGSLNAYYIVYKNQNRYDMDIFVKRYRYTLQNDYYYYYIIEMHLFMKMITKMHLFSRLDSKLERLYL